MQIPHLRPIMDMLVSRAVLPVSMGVTAMLMAGCGPKDVSNDPTYGNFSAVVGTWKAKAPLYLKGEGSDLFLSADRLPPFVQTLAKLPIGTEIQIQHLIYQSSGAADFLYATGSLTAGPYAGKQFQLDNRLFAKCANAVQATPTTPWIQGWAVAPDKLGK